MKGMRIIGKLKVKSKIDAQAYLDGKLKTLLIKDNIYETEEQTFMDKISGNFTVIVENDFPYYISLKKEDKNYYGETFDLLEIIV